MARTHTPPIAHFGGLCRAFECLQAENAADSGFDGSGFDDDRAGEGRRQQDHFERMLDLAERLDAFQDGSGHATRRSLCLSLQQQVRRVEAARALFASVGHRPAQERLDLCRLFEHLLIVGFNDRTPMTTLQCRALHALLARASGA